MTAKGEYAASKLGVEIVWPDESTEPRAKGWRAYEALRGATVEPSLIKFDDQMMWNYDVMDRAIPGLPKPLDQNIAVNLSALEKFGAKVWLHGNALDLSNGEDKAALLRAMDVTGSVPEDGYTANLGAWFDQDLKGGRLPAAPTPNDPNVGPDVGGSEPAKNEPKVGSDGGAKEGPKTQRFDITLTMPAGMRQQYGVESVCNGVLVIPPKGEPRIDFNDSTGKVQHMSVPVAMDRGVGLKPSAPLLKAIEEPSMEERLGQLAVQAFRLGGASAPGAAPANAAPEAPAAGPASGQGAPEAPSRAADAEKKAESGARKEGAPVDPEASDVKSPDGQKQKEMAVPAGLTLFSGLSGMLRRAEKPGGLRTTNDLTSGMREPAPAAPVAGAAATAAAVSPGSPLEAVQGAITAGEHMREQLNRYAPLYGEVREDLERRPWASREAVKKLEGFPEINAAGTAWLSQLASARGAMEDGARMSSMSETEWTAMQQGMEKLKGLQSDRKLSEAPFLDQRHPEKGEAPEKAMSKASEQLDSMIKRFEEIAQRLVQSMKSVFGRNSEQPEAAPAAPAP